MHESRQEVAKVISLTKMAENLPSVSSPLNISTVFTLSIGSAYLLTIHVLKFEIVLSVTSSVKFCCVHGQG